MLRMELQFEAITASIFVSNSPQLKSFFLIKYNFFWFSLPCYIHFTGIIKHVAFIFIDETTCVLIKERKNATLYIIFHKNISILRNERE